MNAALKRYQCQICGFVYDKAAGDPESGLPVGTRWDEAPADWRCPDCGNPKSAFAMEEI